MRLSYAIKFVADMDRAVAYHRDVLGLTLKFATPFWSEFATGETTLALHPSSDQNPAGSVQVGFSVDDLDAFYAERNGKDIDFTRPPSRQEGANLTTFRDSEGALNSLSG